MIVQRDIEIQRLDRIRVFGMYKKDLKSLVFAAGKNSDSPRFAFEDWDQYQYQRVFLAGKKAESPAGQPARQVKRMVNRKYEA